MTGTMALGFDALNLGVGVDLNLEPQSSRSKGISTSAQAKVIANLRKDNSKVIRGVFRQYYRTEYEKLKKTVQ